MKDKIALYLVLALFFASIPSFALAEDTGDLSIGDFEIEKLLNFGSGLLAAGLFTATFLAYKRTKNKRLVYVSIAFFLFAAKGFLTSHELFFEEWPWVDPTASFLNFAILLSFFFGVMKK